MAHRRRVEALDQEDAGLLHFGDEGDFLAGLHGHREAQHHFVEVAFQGLLAGVEVQRDARVPLLAEDFRALRRFEGQVLDIDALQGELRVFALGGAVGSLVGHSVASRVVMRQWEFRP
ncbi:hypothetical protein D9M70_455380 [compost metagenome]